MTSEKPYVVIFVCTGNICRSPMAEGILKDFLIDRARDTGRSAPVKVLSAGIHAIPGNGVSHEAVVAALEDGVDISGHHARLLDGELLAEADLVLTMTDSHRNMIIRMWDSTAEVETLGRYGMPDSVTSVVVDVPDPIGLGIGVYRDVYRQLKHEIKRTGPMIVSRAGRTG